MNREQRLALLEQQLAEIRGGGPTVEDTVGPSRALEGLPTAYEYGAGAQDRAPVLRPSEMPPVTVPPLMLDQHGRVIGYGNLSTWHQPPSPTAAEPKIDVLTQRLIGAGVAVGAGGVGLAFLLQAAAAAVVPLALIAAIVVSLAVLKMSGKSGGSGAVNVNVSVRTDQRNG